MIHKLNGINAKLYTDMIMCIHTARGIRTTLFASLHDFCDSSWSDSNPCPNLMAANVCLTTFQLAMSLKHVQHCIP